jgi:hypothetical protein
VRNLPRKFLGKLGFVVCVDSCIVTSPRHCLIRSPALQQCFLPPLRQPDRHFTVAYDWVHRFNGSGIANFKRVRNPVMLANHPCTGMSSTSTSAVPTFQGNRITVSIWRRRRGEAESIFGRFRDSAVVQNPALNLRCIPRSGGLWPPCAGHKRGI